MFHDHNIQYMGFSNFFTPTVEYSMVLRRTLRRREGYRWNPLDIKGFSVETLYKVLPGTEMLWGQAKEPYMVVVSMVIISKSVPPCTIDTITDT